MELYAWNYKRFHLGVFPGLAKEAKDSNLTQMVNNCNFGLTEMLFLLLVRWKILDATEDVPNCWCFPPWQGGIFLQKPLFRRHCNRLFGGNTLQGTNMSHLGKRKIIFKSVFWWDMLVPRRVFHKIPSFYSKHLVSLPSYPVTRSPQ